MAPRGEPTASIVGMVAACAAMVLTGAAPVRAEPPASAPGSGLGYALGLDPAVAAGCR
jgi:hypothetical protein